MPLIQSPNPKPRRTKITVRLDEPLARTVHRYAEFIRATNEYVIAHALNYFFERDQDFKQWLAANPNGVSRSRSRASNKIPGDLDEDHRAELPTPINGGQR
jgi:predicted transcriptional regulator